MSNDLQSTHDGSGRAPIVATESGELKAPENIMTNIWTVRAIYSRLRTQHLERIELYSSIKGMIDGNPPYDPEELEQNGIDHIANFNDMSSSSTFERAALAHWNLLNQTQSFVKFSLHFPGEPNAPKYAEIMSRNFDYVVRKWPPFEKRVNRLAGQLVQLGVSPVIWPDELDWRWRVVDLSKLFVPDQAPDDTELLTFFAIESTFDVQYLFQVYEKFKDKPEDKTLWNVEELERLLLHFANQHSKDRSTSFVDMVEVQKSIQNNDMNYGDFLTDNIRVVSFIQKEYSGKYSHYMFHVYYDGGDFLFKASEIFEKLEDFIVLFTASPGEETIHGSRGVGHRMYSTSQAMMQLNCSIIDMARMSSTPFLRGAPTQDSSALRVFPGVPTHIGNTDFVQTNFGANISQLIGASDFLQSRLEFNIANAGDNPAIPDSNEQGSLAPSQARSMVFKEHGILKNHIKHFYNKFDLVIVNMVSRMLKSKEGQPGHKWAKEWKRRCVADGVPEFIFNNSNTRDINPLTGLPLFLDVKASRVAGDGSTVGQIMGLQELTELLGGDIGGPREVKAYRRQAVLATLGSEYLDEYMQESSEADERAGGASLAALENAVMEDGRAPVFSPDNEHRSHTVTHIALGSEIIDRLQQQQMDPVQADKVFHVLVPHMQQHFQAVQVSPFNASFAAQVEQPVMQIANYAQLNRKNAMAMLKSQEKQQRQNAEQQQEAMTDAQRKDFIAAKDEERKNYQLQAKEERTAEAQKTRADIMREKVHLDAQNQKRKVELEANIKQNKAANEMNLAEIRANIQKIKGDTPSPADIE